MGSIDREFLRFCKELTTSYQENLKQLRKVTLECDYWKESAEEWKKSADWLMNCGISDDDSSDEEEPYSPEQTSRQVAECSRRTRASQGADYLVNPYNMWEIKQQDSLGYAGSFSSFSNDNYRYMEVGVQLQVVKSFHQRKESLLPHPRPMVLSGNFGPEISSLGEQETEQNWIMYQRSRSTLFSSDQHEEIQQFIGERQQCGFASDFGPSPFLGHHLVLVINDHVPPQRLQQFFNDAKILLCEFGCHVKYFTLCSGMGLCPAEWYRQLRGFLQLMANVQMVQLKMLPTRAPYETQKAVVWRWNQLKSLNRSICVLPLPTLDHLVALDFENLPGSFIDEALSRNNKTVTSLQVTTTRTLQQAITPWQPSRPIPLENLSELSTTFREMQQIRKLKYVTWPLTTLTLRLAPALARYSSETSNLQEVFNILHQSFKNSLRELRLTILSRMDINSRLILPKLKSLSVYFTSCACLNFITTLDSLEELKVHLSLQRMDSPQDVIKFNQHLKSMRKSNIWELLPSLMRVEMTTHFEKDDSTRTYYDRRPSAN